jgi:hypothetical protein
VVYGACYRAGQLGENGPQRLSYYAVMMYSIYVIIIIRIVTVVARAHKAVYSVYRECIIIHGVDERGHAHSYSTALYAATCAMMS